MIQARCAGSLEMKTVFRRTWSGEREGSALDWREKVGEGPERTGRSVGGWERMKWLEWVGRGMVVVRREEVKLDCGVFDWMWN